MNEPLFNKNKKLEFLNNRLIELELENYGHKEQIVKLNGELQSHINEKVLLNKRLEELKFSYRTLKNNSSVISLKEFRNIKGAIPLLENSLESTNKSLQVAKMALIKYNRFIAQ